MDKKDLIEDSLEFCRDIKIFFGEESLKNPNKDTENIKKNIELNYPNTEKSKADDTVFNDIYYDASTENIEHNKSVNPLFKSIISLVLCISLACLSAIFITTYIVQHTKVDGKSMESTLKNEDILIVDKLSYRFKSPDRYDIIVFKYSKNINYIKRIIGLPGETVKIKDGEIFIDGNILNENYGKEVILDSGIAENGITLGEDEYFVMGDNRNHSEDSRFAKVGVINKDRIIGKAWIRIFPFNKIGVLKHK